MRSRSRHPPPPPRKARPARNGESAARINLARAAQQTAEKSALSTFRQRFVEGVRRIDVPSRVLGRSLHRTCNCRRSMIIAAAPWSARPDGDRRRATRSRRAIFAGGYADARRNVSPPRATPSHRDFADRALDAPSHADAAVEDGEHAARARRVVETSM